MSWAREPPRDGRKRSQLILARKGSGAGALVLQGIKRDAPAAKSGGTGGHTAPEGVGREAQGGSNPPAESRGQGLTLRRAPLVTAGAEPGGGTATTAHGHGAGMSQGEPQAAPHPQVGLKSGVGVPKQPPALCHPPPPPCRDRFVYTQLVPVRMVMEVTAMMQNMYTYTIQVYALVLTVKESFKPRMKKFRPWLPIIPMQPAYLGLIQIHLKQ